MARRSIWDDEENIQGETASPMGWETQTDEVQPERPASILDQLRTAEPKIQRVRDRSWESKHPGRTYRKVPNQVRDTVSEIAEACGYNASQIAQAFLDYALMCFRRGDFKLELELSQRGLALMPEGWSAEKKPIWAENAWRSKPPKKVKRRKRNEKLLYKQQVTYRLSPDLVDQIDDICEARRNHDGSLINRTYHDGEVVTRFLAFAIEAYNSGVLALRDTEDA